MELIHVKLNYDFLFLCGLHRLQWGVALLWNSDVNINLFSYNMHHIDTLILHNENLTWRSGFYDHLEQSEKKHS